MQTYKNSDRTIATLKALACGPHVFHEDLDDDIPGTLDVCLRCGISYHELAEQFTIDGVVDEGAAEDSYISCRDISANIAPHDCGKYAYWWETDAEAQAHYVNTDEDPAALDLVIHLAQNRLSASDCELLADELHALAALSEEDHGKTGLDFVEHSLVNADDYKEVFWNGGETYRSLIAFAADNLTIRQIWWLDDALNPV